MCLNYFIKKFFIPLMIILLCITQAGAEIAGPGWFMETAAPISHSEARSYYKARSMALQRAAAISTTPTAEIVELARGLQHDPKLIYEYVHNYIEYVPYFGSMKGATLTYLDGSGNDFDQASLMIALLRASGYTAQFVYGTMTIPLDQLADWLGIDADLTLAGTVVASGGIPITINTGNSTSIVDRVWVRVNISGVDYVFDPAFKSHSRIPKIDLAQAMGYDRSELLGAATTGARVNDDFVQNLNELGLSSKLQKFSINLMQTIHSQYPNAEVEEIIGGFNIVPTELDEYATTLSLPIVEEETWDDIPAAYTHTMQAELFEINQIFDLPNLSGKRLTLTFSEADNYPEIRLDGELVAESRNGMFPGEQYEFWITIDHPYVAKDGTYCDQTSTYTFKGGSTYAIVYDFGDTSGALLSQRQHKLDSALAMGLPYTSETVLGETLHIMGLNWMRETMLADRLISRLAETISITHHNVGLMAQETGYYIDVKTSFKNVLPRHNDPSDSKAHFNAGVCIASAFEHGILEQLMGSDTPGISTIKLLQIANSEGDRIYFADSSNFSWVKGLLRNYSSATLNDLQSQVSSGHTLILPQDGSIGLGEWQGFGYITRFESPTGGMSLGLCISGGYFGGFPSSEEEINPLVLNEILSASLLTADQDAATETPLSSEPVDMASGAYIFNRTDIALGGPSPLGLSFSRSYNSSLNLVQQSLGYGWTHNYDIRLIRISHGEPGLGMRGPLDAAALITELYIVLDLMKNQDDLLGWTVAALAHKWAVDRLIDNAITVNLGNQVMEYIRLANNNYSPPPGVTTALIENGSTFSLQERFGTRLDFDANDRIMQLTDVDDNTLTFTYNGDKLATVQDCFGRTLNLSYDTNGRITRVSDSTGRSISYNYNTNGNLKRFIDPQSKVWQYSYDAERRLISLSEPPGVITVVNTYDSLGRVATQTMPRQNGAQAIYNFYFSGFRNEEEDPTGGHRVYFYDKKGRNIAVQDPLDNKKTLVYDGQNQVLRGTDPRGNDTRFAYDGNHNLRSIYNTLNQETKNVYDSEFRLRDIIDPLGHITHFDYDTEHHLTCTIDAESNKILSWYNPNGLVAATRDCRGTDIVYKYDAYGNPRKRQVAGQPPVVTVYDSRGQMLTLIDQAEAKTGFNYDNRGLVTKTTDSLGKVTRYTYTPAGRLASITDRNGDTIGYAYTYSGKIESITYPDLSAITFDYDILDNPTEMEDALGTSTYIYDAASQIVSSTDPHGFTVSYEYDEAGNLITLTYPGDKMVTYTYDALNRIEMVTNWLGQSARYLYDVAGRLVRMETFNGIVTTYDYDAANRLTSLDTTPFQGTYSFILDANGNRVKETRSEPYSPPSPAAGSVSYTYNLKHNRLLSAGSDIFDYDFEGQLKQKNGISYTFDYEHRLIGIGSSTAFFYDGVGKRLKAERDGVTTKHIYDAAGNLLAEADASGTITRYYIYGQGLLSMVTPENEVYCYHYNPLGSTVAITDADQNRINMYAYSPFGMVTGEIETIPQPFKFVGKYGVMAEPNGMYYMSTRYYDSEVGRFISEDPLGFAGGDVNLYVYALNNPIMFIDSLGMCIYNDDGKPKDYHVGNDAFKELALTIGKVVYNEYLQETAEPIKEWAKDNKTAALGVGAITITCISGVQYELKGKVDIPEIPSLEINDNLSIGIKDLRYSPEEGANILFVIQGKW